MVCFKCGIYGHHQEECPSMPHAKEENLQKAQKGADTVENNGGRACNVEESADTHEVTVEGNEHDGRKTDYSKRSWGECVTENQMELAGGGSPEVKFGPENLHKRQLWKRSVGTDNQGGKSASFMIKEKSALNSSRDYSTLNEGNRYRQESRRIGEKKGQDQQQGFGGFSDKALKKMSEETVASNSAIGGNVYVGETSMEREKEGVHHVNRGGSRLHTNQKV